MSLLDPPPADWRGSLVAAFDPKRDLPGCWGYYDASKLGLVNGAAVKAWGDLSGQGNGLTQVTAANRPTYNAATQNGLGTVTFTATQWIHSFPAGPGPLQVRAQPYTIACLCKPRAAGSTAALRFPIATNTHAGSGLPNAGIGIETLVAGTQDCWPYGWAGSGTSVNTGGRAINDGQWHVVVIRCSPASELLVVDGYQWALANTQLHGTNAASGAIVLGASSAAGELPFDGDIAEAGLFNAELTVKQIEDLTRHLAAKWGL